MRFISVLCLLLTILLAIPIPQGWGKAILGFASNVGLGTGRVFGQLATSVTPDILTNRAVNSAIKASMQDAKAASGVISSISEGATKAALTKPAAAALIISDAARGALPVIWKAVTTQVDLLKANIYGVIEMIRLYSFKIISKVTGTVKVVPAEIEAAVPVVAPATYFDQIAIDLSSIANFVGRAEREVEHQTAVAAIAMGGTDLGRPLVAKTSEGVGLSLLANPKAASGLAKNFGKTVAEQALLHPGNTIRIAMSAAKGSIPVLALFFYNAFRTFVTNVVKLAAEIPTKSMLAVQELAQKMQINVFKMVHPILTAPRPLAMAGAPVEKEVTGLLLVPEALLAKGAETIKDTPETLALAAKLKSSLLNFETIGGSIAGIGVGSVAVAGAVSLSNDKKKTT